jgi:hypothetical protein
MKKRSLTPFSLAFLDIMFCGFGAVVLLVMILNGEVLRKREAKSEDLRGELSRATTLEVLAQQHLTEIRQKVEAATLKEGGLKTRVAGLEAEIGKAKGDQLSAQAEARRVRSAAARLNQQKEALERSAQIVRTQKSKEVKSGQRAIGFTGDGQRQYLTGLKLGGSRTLILLDASASMLDETVVNVVRRKLMDPARRRQAPKWQRVVRSAHWIIANLQRGTQFQVMAFNTSAKPVVTGTAGRWLSSLSAANLQAALAGIRALTPEGGTSLHKAFKISQSLKPRPDNIILLTDGLPTQGDTKAKPGLVTSEERLAHFRSALAHVPAAVPVNTMLFPMEGDPGAAVSFWQLAIKSRGSFIAPSRDWP